MIKDNMDIGSTIQHDLRREFHNMLGILKIIHHERLINDEELKSMLVMCLQREANINLKFEELSGLLESHNV